MHEDDDIDEVCEGCGDGDKVPATGYWRCPVCDSEWDDLPPGIIDNIADGVEPV